MDGHDGDSYTIQGQQGFKQSQKGYEIPECVIGMDGPGFPRYDTSMPVEKEREKGNLDDRNNGGLSIIHGENGYEKKHVEGQETYGEIDLFSTIRPRC